MFVGGLYTGASSEEKANLCENQCGSPETGLKKLQPCGADRIVRPALPSSPVIESAGGTAAGQPASLP